MQTLISDGTSMIAYIDKFEIRAQWHVISIPIRS